MTARFRRPAWEIHHADALLWLQRHPDTPVDAVVTDPPYSSGGAHRSDRTRAPSSKYRTTGAAALPEFSGDNRDQRSFAWWCTLWLSAALARTKPGGHLLAFTDWRQLPTFTDAVQAGGWVWRGVGVWHKPKGAARPTKGGLWNDTEFIVWATNGPHRPAPDAPYLDGVFHGRAPANKVHVTEKPLEVLDGLVGIVPVGATILDPFAGSGTTGVAALRSGRSFIGVEMDAHFAALSAQRLRNVERGAGLDDPEVAPTLWEVAG